MVDGIRANFQVIGKNENIFATTKLSADSGFHAEENMKMLFTDEIVTYIADNQFRKRDPRFVETNRYKECHRKDQAKKQAEIVYSRPLTLFSPRT